MNISHIIHKSHKSQNLGGLKPLVSSFYTLKMASEAISEYLISKKFFWGSMPPYLPIKSYMFTHAITHPCNSPSQKLGCGPDNISPFSLWGVLGQYYFQIMHSPVGIYNIVWLHKTGSFVCFVLLFFFFYMKVICRSAKNTQNSNANMRYASIHDFSKKVDY